MNYLFRQTYEVLQNLIDYIENWVYNKIGVAGGLATLNEDGKVPSEQIDLESIVPAMTQEEASAGVEEAQRTISPEVLATAVDEKVSPLDERVSAAEGNIQTLDEKVSPLDERVSAAEGNIQTLDETAADLNERLETVEQLAEISIGGGDIGIATAADFDNPTPEQRAKVPTVGAVLDGISEGVFDLTAKTGDSYATLADALTAANTAIPTNKKKGGMSIKYVLSSDNKYVQYRLMHTLSNTSTASADFANTANWQGVNDNKIAAAFSYNGYIKLEEGTLKWKGLFASNTITGKTIRITDGTHGFFSDNSMTVEPEKLFCISKSDFDNANTLSTTLHVKDILDYDILDYYCLGSTRGTSIVAGSLILDLVDKYSEIQTKKKVEKFIAQETERLNLIMGATPTSGIGLSTSEWGKKCWTTPKYLRCENSIKLTSASYFVVDGRNFDLNFNYAGTMSVAESTLNSDTGLYELEIVITAPYIKLNFINNLISSSYTDFVPEIQIEGLIDTIYTKPSSNQIALTIPVNVTNPNSCDQSTSTLQDSEQILFDYGVLNLPDTYSNIGKPTRMIIFCHGSAIHYVKNQTTFQTTAYGTDPAYWLSEGYAVMDIEGNPFNNKNVHKFVPQAFECYKAAYNYVVSLFNICKDGVFLGGRSLGGGMCFDIITRSGIPVIAACPFVPSFPNSFMMFSFYNATERAFTALHMGMTGEVTWTAQNPLTDDEIAYLTANKDKFVKYTPSWRAIYDLPAFSELVTVAKATGTYNEAEYNLYSSLRVKSNIPIKLFGAFDDTTVPYRRGIQLWYNMLCNGGNICEMRMFETGGHPFDLVAANRLSTYVNTRGITLSNVPIAYIEALQFWRRYEQ